MRKLLSTQSTKNPFCWGYLCDPDRAAKSSPLSWVADRGPQWLASSSQKCFPPATPVRHHSAAIYSCFLPRLFPPAHQDQVLLVGCALQLTAEFCCGPTGFMAMLCLSCAQVCSKTRSSRGAGRGDDVKSGRTLPQTCHFRSTGEMEYK